MTDASFPQTPRVIRTLESAGAIAAELGHTYVGTEHVLLALANDGDGLAGRVLAEVGVVDQIRLRLAEIMSSPGYQTPSNQVVDEHGNVVGVVRRGDDGELFVDRESPDR
jgi:ATP-dependent Clp protease ATP-binding subunit ClpA